MTEPLHGVCGVCITANEPGRWPLVFAGCLSERTGILTRTPVASSVGLSLAGFAFDRVVHFFAMDCNIARSVDAKANFVAANFNHHQSDVVTDDDLLVFFSAEYKHVIFLGQSFIVNDRRPFRFAVCNKQSSKGKPCLNAMSSCGPIPSVAWTLSHSFVR